MQMSIDEADELCVGCVCVFYSPRWLYNVATSNKFSLCHGFKAWISSIYALHRPFWVLVIVDGCR